MLSKLKDADGKVLIPGFYDDVQKPTDDELKAWASLPFNEEEYRKAEVGSDVLTGEPGYSVLYRTWARPTLEVHGIIGGFIAPGAKTVIPAKGSAKVSMRLVPNQDADDILKKFTAYVAKITPKGITSSRQGAQQGAGVCGEHGQSVCAGVGGGDARGVRQGHGVHPVGRVDSDCHAVREGPEDSQHHDGDGAAGR